MAETRSHDPLRRLTLFGWGRAFLMAPGDASCLRDSDVVWPHTRFEYDARNRRVARQEVSTGRWTHTVFDAAGNPLSELARTSDAASPWRKVRDYVWLDGRPLAQIEYPGPAGSGEGYAYYFHVDHLGLPRALSNEAGQVVWSASVTPYGEVAETTATDPLSGTTVVTNLRLPGQYDERLFAAAGISGMQGPYYNVNRWYMPSVGRYMELDPIALRGGMNGPHGPDWYNYADGNPLTKMDPFGLDAEMCTRKFNTRFPPPYARHCFIRFNGDNGDTLSFDPGGVHPDPNPTKPGAQCTPTGGGNRDKCVKREMARCRNYDFLGFNCCHCAEQALKACGIELPVDAWPNWPINPGPQPGEPGYDPNPVFP